MNLSGLVITLLYGVTFVGIEIPTSSVQTVSFGGVLSEQLVCENDGSLSPQQESVLRGIARGESMPWVEITPTQAHRLYDKVEEYTCRYRLNHLPHGLNADVIWRDPERSSVDHYDGLGDGLIWSGHYLASLGLKYSLEPTSDIREEILALLDTIELLMTVSGRSGYLARYTGPGNDPAYKPYYRVYKRGEDPSRPGFGKQAYRGVPPHESLVWLGDSSRDAYDGFLFGVAFVWVYVDDKDIRSKIRRLTTCLAERMLTERFWILDGKSNITNPTPWFRLAFSRLFMTVVSDKFDRSHEDDLYPCAWCRLSTAERRYKWISTSYDLRLCVLTAFGLCIKDKHADKYYPANLDFILMASLCALETNSKNLYKLKSLLHSMYKDQANDHLNAHFAAIYMLVTGDVVDNDARATLQGQLIDFPADKWAHAVDLRDDPTIAQHNQDFTEHALLTHERVPRNFLWERSPCLSHGGRTDLLEYPALDLILPYWMGRVAGAIPAP